MRCIKCKTENREGDKTCRKCGQQLPAPVAQEIKFSSYNWIPAAIMILLLITAFLVLKLWLKY